MIFCLVIMKKNNNNNKEHIFSGKRIKRGPYKSKNGTLLNADVNGAANILRKVFLKVKSNTMG